MHKLPKPYTSKQKSDFIVKHNHQGGLKIAFTDDAIYALEKTEFLESGRIINYSNHPSLIEEKSQQLKAQRNSLLESISWRIERYNEQKELEIDTNDSEEVYKNLLVYKQYLRDIPQEDEFPNVEIKTFDEFVSAEE